MCGVFYNAYNTIIKFSVIIWLINGFHSNSFIAFGMVGGFFFCSECNPHTYTEHTCGIVDVIVIMSHNGLDYGSVSYYAAFN